MKMVIRKGVNGEEVWSMRNLILSKEEQKNWGKLSIISLLYVFPIILANRYYNDDLSRSLMGLTGWSGDGRPVTEYLM